MKARDSLQHLCQKLPFVADLDILNILGYHKIQVMTVFFTCEHQKIELGMSFLPISFILTS